MAILGCIADDFTGASDMASFLVKGGMRTILYNGIPSVPMETQDIDALVIALKTRTQNTENAVSVSLQAIQWLQKNGCTHYYIKYCSTFDSTETGNIGPICDAVMDYLKVHYTLLCPALPVNGRTVQNGNLYVNGIPLHHSSMKDHPLTPMWDCDLKKLMEPQSRYTVYKIGNNPDQWNPPHSDPHYYLVPDCENEEDCRKIVEYFGHETLLTGGSGLACTLAKKLLENRNTLPGSRKNRDPATGNVLLLAGSCSETTRKQITYFQNHGGYSIQITPEAILDPSWNIRTFWRDIQKKLQDHHVLIYSSETPERVRQIQETFGDVSCKLEETASSLAQFASENGICKIVSAGGETSGAVTKKLGSQSFIIGESIAPGVPMMIPKEKPNMKLVLKSGNFGQEDFFVRAIQLLDAK